MQHTIQYTMELQLLSSVLLPFLFFIFLLSKIVKRSGSETQAPNLPPGPWRLPILGNIHQLFGSPPHQKLHVLAKKYGTIMHLQLGELHHVIISSAEAAKEVLKTHDVNFAYRPSVLVGRVVLHNCTDIVFAPYGDYWKQLRRICITELLSTKRVQSFRSIREEEVSKVIRLICGGEGSVIDLSSLFITLGYNIISRAAIGNIHEDQATFIPIAKTITKDGGGLTLSDLFPSSKLLPIVSGFKYKLERVSQEADMVLDKIINRHKDKKVTAKTTAKDEADDLVDVLLSLQDGGNLEFPLTTDNIKAVVLDLFVAGSETSSSTMEWAMSELVKNPKEMGKAQLEVRELFGNTGKVDEARIDELNYLKLVLKETLRLHPPVPMLVPRECQEECEIKGFRIPSKSRVIINAWAIGRDPNYWVEAERFYPERFLDDRIDYRGGNFEYIPFGGGRRICPGMSFGIAAVLIVLASLLFHFDWKVPGEMKPENLDMLEDSGFTLRRKNALKLIPVYTHPLSAVDG